MGARARIDRLASAVLLAGLLTLIADMFLAWVKVTVYSPGLFGTSLTLDLHATGSGWAGWGIAGGILAVFLVLRHARSLRRGVVSARAAAVTAALAAATAGFTTWQALTGKTEVAADGTLLVTVTRLWPAEAAIGLGAVVLAAAATRLVTAALVREPLDYRGLPGLTAENPKISAGRAGLRWLHGRRPQAGAGVSRRAV